MPSEQKVKFHSCHSSPVGECASEEEASHHVGGAEVCASEHVKESQTGEIRFGQHGVNASDCECSSPSLAIASKRQDAFLCSQVGKFAEGQMNDLRLFVPVRRTSTRFSV